MCLSPKILNHLLSSPNKTVSPYTGIIVRVNENKNRIVEYVSRALLDQRPIGVFFMNHLEEKYLVYL